jgi:hypothetical protein
MVLSTWTKMGFSTMVTLWIHHCTIMTYISYQKVDVNRKVGTL